MSFPDLKGKSPRERAGACYGIWHEHHPRTVKSAEAPPETPPEAPKPLTPDEVRALGREWLAGLLQEWQAEQEAGTAGEEQKCLDADQEKKCGGEGGKPGPCPETGDDAGTDAGEASQDEPKKKKGNAAALAGEQIRGEVRYARNRAERYPALHAAVAVFGDVASAAAGTEDSKDARRVLDPRRAEQAAKETIATAIKSQLAKATEAAQEIFGDKAAAVMKAVQRTEVRGYVGELARHVGDAVSDARDKVSRFHVREDLTDSLKESLEGMGDHLPLQAFEEAFGSADDFAGYLTDTLSNAGWPPSTDPSREITDAEGEQQLEAGRKLHAVLRGALLASARHEGASTAKSLSLETKCGGPGGKPGVCPGSGGAASATKGSGSIQGMQVKALGRAGRLAGMLRRLPGKVAVKVRQKAAEKYHQLRERYGKGMAIAIMAAGLLGTATPMPGGGLIAAAPLLGAGELYLKLRRGVEPPATAPAPATPPAKSGSGETQKSLTGEDLANQVAEAARLADPAAAESSPGSYRKGHVVLHGLPVVIENARGTVRSGTDAAGQPWSVTLPHHYGYIQRTQDADGEQVDAFIGPRLDSETVYVVDQLNPDGTFDEHKVMLGFASEEDARLGYLQSYAPGWDRLGAVTALDLPEFKRWLARSDTARPAADWSTERVPATVQKSSAAPAPHVGGGCGAACACSGCKRHQVIITYKAAEGRVGMVRPNDEGEIETHDDEMSATCILASSNRDLQGDIIECSGVIFDDHRWNPVVLWNHGKEYNLPVGKAEDPDGEYTVRYVAASDIITQKTYFATTPFARQIYGLVRGRFIRANSIAVKDLEVEPLAPDPARGFPRKRDGIYKHILRSRLAEVTWTPLPANPDAVASLLAVGRIDTGSFAREPIDALIVKSFLPFLPPQKVWSNGLTLKSLIRRSQETSMPENDEDRDDTKSHKDDMDGTVDTEMDDLPDEMPPGAQAIHNLHDFYSAGKDLHGDLSKGQENPAVKELLDELQDQIQETCSRLREVFSEQYPDHDAPQGEDEDEDSDQLDTKSEDERTTPDKVNETAGRPVPDVEGGGDRVEGEKRSRKSDDEDREKKTRRSLGTRSGLATRKSALLDDPLVRTLRRKQERLMELVDDLVEE